MKTEIEELNRINDDMRRIRRVKGLEENIQICQEKIEKYCNKLNDWEKMKQSCEDELKKYQNENDRH